jgi:hypothetical protein
MMRHTQGPWQYQEYCNGQLEVFAGGGLRHYGGKRLVAIVNYSADADHPYVTCAGQRDANARLISAAPSLLEALEMVRDADEDCKKDGLPTIPVLARKKIDAAISKATGAKP